MCMYLSCKYSQTCWIEHLYIAIYKGQFNVPRLMKSTYNLSLYIKGTISSSLQYPLYRGLYIIFLKFISWKRKIVYWNINTCIVNSRSGKDNQH